MDPKDEVKTEAEVRAEDKPEVKDEVLPKKKKQALLLYMSIMFAAAFLIVAISLFANLQSAENANLGAQQNIIRLEAQLEEAKTTVSSQAEELQELSEKCASQDEQLAEINSAYITLSEQFSSGQAALEEANAALALKNDREKATELLLQAQNALLQEKEEDFRVAMEALEPLAEKLTEQSHGLYEALLKNLK